MFQPWIVFSIFSALAYFAHDLVLKQVSSKVDSVLASTILNLSAFMSLLLYSIFMQASTWRKFPWASIESGLIVGAGICLAMASVFFVNIFSNGGDLSLAIPLVYVLIIFLGVLFGVILYKEHLNLWQYLGVLLITVGIMLITRQTSAG
jgi:drug/metabolite transporter (DMT)-like permease